MNNQEAKEILQLFRPGTADEKDAAFDQARQLAKTDPELARWFDQHCRAYLALRRKFQAIPVPPGLKEQILSERKIRRPFFQKHWGPLLAAAAVVVLLIGIESGFPPFHGADGAISGLSQTHDQNRAAQLLHGFAGDKSGADPRLPAAEKRARRLFPACRTGHSRRRRLRGFKLARQPGFHDLFQIRPPPSARGSKRSLAFCGTPQDASPTPLLRARRYLPG